MSSAALAGLLCNFRLLLRSWAVGVRVSCATCASDSWAPSVRPTYRRCCAAGGLRCRSASHWGLGSRHCVRGHWLNVKRFACRLLCNLRLQLHGPSVCACSAPAGLPPSARDSEAPRDGLRRIFPRAPYLLNMVATVLRKLMSPRPAKSTPVMKMPRDPRRSEARLSCTVETMCFVTNKSESVRPAAGDRTAVVRTPHKLRRFGFPAQLQRMLCQQHLDQCTLAAANLIESHCW